MSNYYDLEHKLSQKAESWRVFDLENKLNNLNRDINFLEDKLKDSQNRIYNLEGFLRNLVLYLREINPEKEELIFNF